MSPRASTTPVVLVQLVGAIAGGGCEVQSPSRDHAPEQDFSAFVKKSDLRKPPQGVRDGDPCSWPTGFTTRALCAAARACMHYSVPSRKTAAARLRSKKAKAWIAEMHEELRSEISSDEKLTSVLRVVGERVAAARPTPHMFGGTFQFIASPDVDDNAFAAPGGFIVMATNLMQRLDEAGVAAILGHEIAHVEWSSYDREVLARFHARKFIARMRDLLGTLPSLCQGSMDEAFIDYYGTLYAAKAGYDPSRAVALFLPGAPGSDGLSADDFQISDSHPPSEMRATWIWDAVVSSTARSTRWAWPYDVYYRGKVGKFDPPWNGQVPSTFQ
jgi:hypothetical protein